MDAPARSQMIFEQGWRAYGLQADSENIEKLGHQVPSLYMH